MKAPDAHQNTATYASALLPIVSGAVVLFKLPLDATAQAIIVSGLAGVIGVGILLSDTFIRRGRAQVAIAQHNVAIAQLNALSANPEGDDSKVPPPPPAFFVPPQLPGPTQAQGSQGPTSPIPPS